MDNCSKRKRRFDDHHVYPAPYCFHIVSAASLLLESSGGVVVRALISHQCGPGSIPRLGVICGLSLLVLYSTLRGFSLGTPVFLSPQKPTFEDFICINFNFLSFPFIARENVTSRNRDKIESVGGNTCGYTQSSSSVPLKSRLISSLSVTI